MSRQRGSERASDGKTHCVMEIFFLPIIAVFLCIKRTMSVQSTSSNCLHTHKDVSHTLVKERDACKRLNHITITGAGALSAPLLFTAVTKK
jgi:hypothetical protein